MPTELVRQCSWCRSHLDDKGEIVTAKVEIDRQAELLVNGMARLTHGLCKVCLDKYFPEHDQPAQDKQ